MALGRSSSLVLLGTASKLLFLLSAVNCHVRLDFPPARDYSLDFLDNARTPPPCGMPKGESKTSFEAGTSFNVTWHLGYPHQGGYKIELLDPQENLLQTLTPEKGGSKSNGWIDYDTTAQRHVVTLPSDQECRGCTIRLLRTAAEWGNSYRFWSCADVDIVKRGELSDRSLCSNHGDHDEEKDICICDYTYYGERCQYKNDCEVDEDCQNGGSCIDIDSTTSPQKECFCPAGFFGNLCEKKSSIDERVEDFSSYETRQINDNLDLYWKILEDTKEIEIVMKGKTMNYIALGWRPRGTDGSCQAFPRIGSGKGEVGIEAELRSEPDGVSEPEPEGEAEPSNISKREAEEADAEGIAEPDAEPEGRSEPEPEGDSEPDSEPEGRSFQEVEAESEAESEAEGRSDDDDHKQHMENKYQPRGIIHPMDCTDIVIGKAVGGKSKIYDAYTRDRSTPLADSFFGGKDDLTGAVGYEENGVTTIVFRKKLEGSEETDHSLVNDLTHVIWAYGQTHGMYHHSPLSGLESGQASIEDFYRPDEVKYHGKSNRGVLTLNFFDQTVSATCMNSWKFPADCKNNCQYEARWLPLDDAKIEFKVRQKLSRNSDDWVAIGFSNNKKMTETDIVAGFSNVNGQGSVNDFWASRYSSPELDSSQDIIDGSIVQENGYQLLKFTRVMSTGDEENDIDLSKDVYLVFPYSGGSVFGKDTLGKHRETPFVTGSKVNLKKICQNQAPKVSNAEIEDEALEDLLRDLEPAEPETNAEPKALEEDYLTEAGNCREDEWKYPVGCSNSDCQYIAKWTKFGNYIKVSVQGRSTFAKDWIGIGFSKKPFMPRTDAVIGYVDESGQGVVRDYWISSYGPPDEDSSQDIDVIEIGKRDNMTFMTFLKKFSSDDKQRDVDFNKELYLIFPFSGGPVIAAGTIGQHRMTPEISSEKINFNALCG